MNVRRMHALPGHSARAALILSLLLSLFSAAQAASPIPAGHTPRTTVIVFSDRPLQPDQWRLLFAGLRSGLAGGAETQMLDQGADFIRGDDLVPGLLLGFPIVVFLHGDCTLAPAARRTAYGVPLGWVHRVDGRIDPFVHVDCTHIGEVLGPQAARMSKKRRAEVMSTAIARVILHEWIHIVTQSPAHASDGIEKAQYGVADLMGGQ